MEKRKLEKNMSDEMPRKKIKLIDTDDKIVDSSLQYINEDTAKTIVNFLKLSMVNLVALSLSCKRWHKLIGLTADEVFRHLLPNSFGKYDGEARKKILRQYYTKPSWVEDLQLFEFYRDDKELGLEYVQNIHVVPWAPHIVFIVSFKEFFIFDLKNHTKQRQVVKNNELSSISDDLIFQFGFDTTKKIVVVLVIQKAVESLLLFQIDSNGDIKQSKGPIEIYRSNAPHFSSLPSYSSLYFDSHGQFWPVSNLTYHNFSIDEQLNLTWKYFTIQPHNTIGIGEFDHKVFTFIVKESIWVVDATEGKVVGELAGSKILSPEGVYNSYKDKIEYPLKVEIIGNVALVLNNSQYKPFVKAVYNMTTFSKVPCQIPQYDLEREFVATSALSPDLTTIVHLKTNQLIFATLGSEETSNVCAVNLDGCCDVQWIEDRAFVVTSYSRISMDSTSTELKEECSYQLPVWGGVFDHFNRATIRNTVFFAKGDNSARKTSIYRITIK